jgi:hypothetical protein
MNRYEHPEPASGLALVSTSLDVSEEGVGSKTANRGVTRGVGPNSVARPQIVGHVPARRTPHIRKIFLR